MTTIEPFLKRIQKVGIICKRNISERLDYLKSVISLLKKHQKDVYFDTNAEPLISGKLGLKKYQLLQKCDLVLVLGGDGTLLKTASRAIKKKTLVLGVNLGTLGFLSETTPERLSEDLAKIFANDYVVDRRSVLRATHYRNGQKINTFLALNDAVINQGSFARLIEMRIDIDQRKMVTLRADGLIIASPTGSTGHSLSAGGPIVHPSLGALILTPICPATLAIRPIVIPNDRQIKITIITKRRGDEQVGLTLDGQATIPLMYGDEIKIRKSSRCFHLVRLKNDKYYKMLRTKLHWGEH